MLTQSGARAQRAKQQVGTREADRVDLVAQHLRRRQELRDHRAHAHERHARPAGRAAHCVPARQHELAIGLAAKRLVDRTRREPEIGRLATGPAQPRQRVQQRPFEVLAEGGLPRGAARLGDADRGSDDRLVGAALGRERHATRRADQDRLSAGVHPERPRLERAPDEGVVDRPDRQQRLAVAAPGGAQLAQQAHQVGLGDAQLDVMAARGLVPVHERLGVVLEPVAPLAHRPDLTLVDPAAQVGRAGHVRADRDHPLGHLGGVVHEVDEEAPEGLLGRSRTTVLSAQHRRHRRRRHRLRFVPRQRRCRGRAQLGLGGRPGRTRPTDRRRRRRAPAASSSIWSRVSSAE